MRLIKLLRIIASASETDRQAIKMCLTTITIAVCTLLLTAHEFIVVQDEARAGTILLYGLLAMMICLWVMMPDEPAPEPAQIKS